jgi:hypothetical protein
MKISNLPASVIEEGAFREEYGGSMTLHIFFKEARSADNPVYNNDLWGTG